MHRCTFVAAALLSLTLAAPAQATPSTAHWPTQDGTYTIHNFHFKDGESIPELRLHYITLGTPHRDTAGHVDNAILLLHGTGGNAHSLTAPEFSDPLFGPGEPFDITKFFLILPDDIGHGQSSKPSDGLRMRFPSYDYDDMVASQHTMLTDGLHIDHLRLILGTSMGCMESFTWGEAYPQAMDGLATLACLPVALVGRNRIWRDMAMDDIKNDPAWKHGHYKAEPREGLRAAFGLTILAGSGPIQLQKTAPTAADAQSFADRVITQAITHNDANDFLYYTNASRNYDPEAKLGTITTPVLWINSADDYVNPAELGIAETTVTRMPHANFILLPISDITHGHYTFMQASIFQHYLADFMTQTAK